MWCIKHQWWNQADTPVLETGVFGRAGSSPAWCILIIQAYSLIGKTGVSKTLVVGSNPTKPVSQLCGYSLMVKPQSSKLKSRVRLPLSALYLLDIAQLGSARGLGPWGRRFESCYPDYTLMKRKLIKMLTTTETIILSLILGLLVMIPILSVLLLLALNAIALLIIGVILYIVIVGFSIKMFNYDKN